MQYIRYHVICATKTFVRFVDLEISDEYINALGRNGNTYSDSHGQDPNLTVRSSAGWWDMRAESDRKKVVRGSWQVLKQAIRVPEDPA